MTSGFIMLYSDILFEENIMSKILTCQEDIVLVVDNTMQYHAPEANKIQDLLSVKINTCPPEEKLVLLVKILFQKLVQN